MDRRENPGESRNDHFADGAGEAYDSSGQLLNGPASFAHDTDRWAAWNNAASTVPDPGRT